MSGRIQAADFHKFHSPLYADFIAGRLDGMEDAHVSYTNPDRWGTLVERALSECRATPELWAEIEKYNALRCAARPAMENLGELAAGRAAVIVTGQQPGLLGGPLLVLYKAATAVALAERVAEATGVRCAPIFLVSGDDSDFAEISRCTAFDGSLRRLNLSFSAEDYTAGLMVGALEAAKEEVLARSLLDAVGESPGKGYVSDLLGRCFGAAADHGEFVAAILSHLFSSDGLIVLDGRSVEMRRAAAGLFRSYLAQWEELAIAVKVRGKEFEQRGYHAQLAGPGLDRWLFVVEDGVRKKGGLDEGELLSRAAVESPESLTPNVALRPLWRDSMLPVVFGVLGPSEVAYTLQLTEAYKILNVPHRGLFPRLGATLVPPEGVEVAGGWNGKALSTLLNDYEGTLRSHYRRLVPGEAAAAIARAAKTARESMEELERSLSEVSGGWGKAARSLAHEGEKGLSKLDNDMVDSLKREARRTNPRLKGLGAFLFPDGRPQERELSLLVPLLARGRPFVRDLLDMAGEHVRECSLGRVRHYCYKP